MRSEAVVSVGARRLGLYVVSMAWLRAKMGMCALCCGAGYVRMLAFDRG